MFAESHTREQIRVAQDQSWEDGYFSGRDGDERRPPENTTWPSHWYVGYDSATADKLARHEAAKKAIVVALHR